MRKAILSIIFSVLAFSVFSQSNNNFNGFSLSTGNLHPDGSNFGVALQNELIRVRQFDSVAQYDIVYELKNNTSSFCTVNTIMPINIYFNEFAYGKRSPLLDQLATITTFTDIFKVQDRSLDTREQIRQNFQQRLFVRKYISIDNLRDMGIYVDVFRNNIRINIKKILCEIKFVDETPLFLPKNTEVLKMEIKFMVEMNFTPDEQTTIMTFLTVPTMSAGIDQKEIYSSYDIGYEKNWAGSVNALYVEHDIFNATPVFPKKFDSYTTHISGDRDQVIIFKNVAPVDNDKLAFYHIQNRKNCNPSGLFNEQILVPTAVKNITASSYVKTDLNIAKRYFTPSAMVAFSDSIQTYQTGNPTGIDMFGKDMRILKYDHENLYDHIAMECKSNQPGIVLKESGHPVFAFDIGDHIFDDTIYTGVEDLARQTCWCEGVSGPGAKEYIEFEITQPSKAIRIFNGNQSNRTIFDGSSKPDIISITNLDGVEINPVAPNKTVYTNSIIDLVILNVYELKMPAGKYRLTVEAIDKGATPATCISSITFDFIVEDEWYQRSLGMLSSFFGKTKQ
ncbi:MAG: NADase-type glycan-binding domain-containing protein [Chitinophagales bacterium]